MTDDPQNFDQLDSESMSLPQEFFWFLRMRKKYWLIRIVALLLLMGLLIILSGGPVAPFIYSLF